MPIPIILAGAALAAGAFGVKKGVDAYNDNTRASDLQTEARQLFEGAQQQLELSRTQTSETLDELGKLKLEVWEKQLGRFVQLFGQLKNVELEGGAELGTLKAFTPEELAEMSSISLRASEVLTGGVTALGAGALAGMAAYGGAFMLGTTATTGTAIASLSGVAATNATLAWLGGGALTAGGLGMAGGMAVLGGLVAGPALAIAGALFAAKAEENLANARKILAEAKMAKGQIDSAMGVLRAIDRLARDYHQAILQLEGRMSQVLDRLQALIQSNGNNYAKFDEQHRKVVHLSLQFAQSMKMLLETPLLTREGEVAPNAKRDLEESHNERLALVATV